MSANSLAGAPLSRALIVTLVVTSTLAAVTANQHLFHLPLAPHLQRDHQVYRLVAHHLVFANSAELFLGVLVLWQTSMGVERVFGTKKYASFLVITTTFSTVLSFVLLIVGSIVTRGRLNVFPAGPFAITFAILYQSHRLHPTLYTFTIFHPLLTLTDRFPVYLLAVLLALSQPPSTLLLALIGLASSAAWTADALGLKRYRLPRRVYTALSRLAPADGALDRLRRGTAVLPEEALIGGLAVGIGGLATVRDATAVTPAGVGDEPAAGRRTVRPVPDVAAPAARGGDTVAGGEVAEEADADPGPHHAPVPPPTASARPLPPISGASFLRQWQAGLTGAPEGPTAAQIAELSGIFPHHSRPAIIAALQTTGHDVTRAAEMLLSEGG
ncbi:hypothetical protein JCM3770_004257 [Rhodotorula araucariae]